MTAIDTTAPAAAKLGRVAAALADQFDRGLFVAGCESLSMLAIGWDLVTWVAREGVLVLQLCTVDEDGTTGPAVRTVTVCPGEFRTFDVIEGDGLVVGEARAAAAAFSIAVERLAAPAMVAHQYAHDAVAV